MVMRAVDRELEEQRKWMTTVAMGSEKYEKY